jgi:hypothetical protein
MRNQLRAMALVLAVALPMTVLSIPAPARAATATTNALAQTSQARLGSRFGRRVPTARYRYPSRTRTRPYTRSYRRSPLRGLFGGVLKALGVAYLFHMLFGWGSGGSPFGLLLLVAIVLWLATRSRRRRVTYF